MTDREGAGVPPEKIADQPDFIGRFDTICDTADKNRRALAFVNLAKDALKPIEERTFRLDLSAEDRAVELASEKTSRSSIFNLVVEELFGIVSDLDQTTKNTVFAFIESNASGLSEKNKKTFKYKNLEAKVKQAQAAGDPDTQGQALLNLLSDTFKTNLAGALMDALCAVIPQMKADSIPRAWQKVFQYMGQLQPDQKKIDAIFNLALRHADAIPTTATYVFEVKQERYTEEEKDKNGQTQKVEKTRDKQVVENLKYGILTYCINYSQPNSTSASGAVHHTALSKMAAIGTDKSKAVVDFWRGKPEKQK